MQKQEESLVQIREKLKKNMNPYLARKIRQTFDRNETERFALQFLKICCQKYPNKKGACRLQEELIDELDDTTKALLEKLLKSDALAAYHLREVCEKYVRAKQLGDER